MSGNYLIEIGRARSSSLANIFFLKSLKRKTVLDLPLKVIVFRWIQ